MIGYNINNILNDEIIKTNINEYISINTKDKDANIISWAVAVSVQPLGYYHKYVLEKMYDPGIHYFVRVIQVYAKKQLNDTYVAKRGLYGRQFITDVNLKIYNQENIELNSFNQIFSKSYDAFKWLTDTCTDVVYFTNEIPNSHPNYNDKIEINLPLYNNFIIRMSNLLIKSNYTTHYSK